MRTRADAGHLAHLAGRATDALVRKPFAIADLVAAVEDVMPRARTRIENSTLGSMAVEMSTGRIRVVIVEDQRVLADALRLSLTTEDDIEVIAVAHDATEGVRVALANDPDVVVMDQHLPGADGVSAARDIRAARPATPVVMLTGDTSDELLIGALNAGMSGYVVKGEPLETLFDAVRRAAAGEIVWPADRLARLLARSQRPARRTEHGLTARERDVLRLMSEGLDNKTIAHRLGISLTTARGYVQAVLRKLDAHSKLEAVVLASRSGLLGAAD